MDFYTPISPLRAGGSGDRIPVGARFSAPVQTDSGAHPASCTMDTRSLSRGKAAGAWRWPPTPSSAEVKETVELYLYTSGPSWPVLGWTLPFPVSLSAYNIYAYQRIMWGRSPWSVLHSKEYRIIKIICNCVCTRRYTLCNVTIREQVI
jgi:hypothetical protein